MTTAPDIALMLVEAGTRLRVVHAGFRPPQNAVACDAMSPGWRQAARGMARVLAEEHDASCHSAQRRAHD